MNTDRIAIITGGFDPLHSGHVAMIRNALNFGCRIVIGLNSDTWLQNKKGKPFLNFEERKEILQNIKGVTWVFDFDDSDGTAINALKKVKETFKRSELTFINGGDRASEDDIPEAQFCRENNINMIFGVGGNKKNSSSWILTNWTTNNKEQRIWGEFKTLYTNGNKVKVKELTIEPQKFISHQRHQNRNEFWIILNGKASLILSKEKNDLKTIELTAGDEIKIEKNTWHKLINIGEKNLTVLEVQYGTDCNESDIERSEM